MHFIADLFDCPVEILTEDILETVVNNLALAAGVTGMGFGDARVDDDNEPHLAALSVNGHVTLHSANGWRCFWVSVFTRDPVGAETIEALRKILIEGLLPEAMEFQVIQRDYRIQAPRSGKNGTPVAPWLRTGQPGPETEPAVEVTPEEEPVAVSGGE